MSSPGGMRLTPFNSWAPINSTEGDRVVRIRAPTRIRWSRRKLIVVGVPTLISVTTLATIEIPSLSSVRKGTQG